MTEVEAFSLKPGEQVVMRRPGRKPCQGCVVRIYPYDMTTELASTLFAVPEYLAVKFTFDGPIIEVDLNGRQTMWQAPHVSRAPVKLNAHCRFCERRIVLMVPFQQYRELQAGVNFEQVQLDPELRQSMESHLCSICAKK